MNSAPLRPLGKIAGLQLQRSVLRHGEEPNRVYDPATLIVVDELKFSPQGISAQLPEGEVLDLHHADHPQSKNVKGKNSISVNFTSHYAAMRQKYGKGDHLYDRCGGENVLIEAVERIELDRVALGLAVRSAKTGAVLRLTNALVAHPCLPFSRYVSGRTESEAVLEALKFLDDGLRGFYFACDTAGVVAVGDEVFET